MVETHISIKEVALPKSLFPHTPTKHLEGMNHDDGYSGDDEGEMR